MGMSIEVIYDKLKNKDSKLYLNDHEHMLINEVRLYRQNQSYFRTDILYIINDSTLSKLPLEFKCANILCTGKSNSLKLSNSLHANMLFMNDNTDSEMIADRIEIILDKQQVLLQYTSILFELLSQGKGLQQIINKGYEMLGNMVLLSDISMNVTLHSENAKFDDDLKEWIYEDKTENYNTFYIKHREKRGFEKSYISRYPMYIGKDMDTYAYLASDVIVDNNVIAHLIVIEYEKPFKEEDYEIISLLCKIVSLKLQKDDRFICNTRGYLYEYLFLDLLEGKIKDPLIIEDRIESLDIELKENLYVFTIVVNKDEQFNTRLSYIRNLLEDMIKNSKSVIYNDNIMLLINTSGDEEPFHKVDLETLKKFLKNNKMQGGLSYCFHNLKDLKDYYKQSLTSIEMGIHLKKEENIFLYEDYAIYHIFHICAKNENLKCFCHPSILTLIEYDKKYNTDFTYTLYAYLNHERNQTDTAKVLHIHRSTLLYRIKKAEEIMNLSLKSNSLVYKHYVTFKMLEFMGEFPELR